MTNQTKLIILFTVVVGGLSFMKFAATSMAHPDMGIQQEQVEIETVEEKVVVQEHVGYTLYYLPSKGGYYKTFTPEGAKHLLCVETSRGLACNPKLRGVK